MLALCSKSLPTYLLTPAAGLRHAAESDEALLVNCQSKTASSNRIRAGRPLNARETGSPLSALGGSQDRSREAVLLGLLIAQRKISRMGDGKHGMGRTCRWNARRGRPV